MKIAKMMNLTVNYDHRHVDGAVGTRIVAGMEEVWKNPHKYL